MPKKIRKRLKIDNTYVVNLKRHLHALPWLDRKALWDWLDGNPEAVDELIAEVAFDWQRDVIV